MKWRKIYNYYLGSSAAMIVLLFVMGAAVIYPALSKIIAIKNEIAAEKKNLENKLDMGLNAKRIIEDLKTVEDRLSLLDTVFIKQGEELTLLSSIEELAAASGVTVVLKPDFNGVSLPGNISRTSLTISATGPFSGIMRFLSSLDGTDYFFISEQITLARADKDGYRLNIAGQVYVKNADQKQP